MTRASILTAITDVTWPLLADEINDVSYCLHKSAAGINWNMGEQGKPTWVTHLILQPDGNVKFCTLESFGTAVPPVVMPGAFVAECARRRPKGEVPR